MVTSSIVLTSVLLVSSLVALVYCHKDDAKNRKLFDLNEAIGSLDTAEIDANEAHSSHPQRNKTAKPDWIETLFKKKPYSQYWSPEKKWEDIFLRFVAISESSSNSLLKGIVKNLETYADVAISSQCAEDIRWTQDYKQKSSNFRWAIHMADSSGHIEPGMLTGNLANLGHVIQCINVRAPSLPNNDTFDERYFEQQTKKYGERFRGKYCLASIRAVMPERPRLVSRFSDIIDTSELSNISYTGESPESIKQRLKQLSIPSWLTSSIDRQHNRIDQVPFESELFQFLILQRNFMYTLPRMLGVCFPSSCNRDDIRQTLQKFFEDQHQVVDIEFECETEPVSSWSWFNTSRLIVYVLLGILFTLTFGASLARYILVDKLALKRRLPKNSPVRNLIGMLDLMSMDKCAGILLIKMKPASTEVDESKLENQRSTSIDALKGFLMLALVYSQLVHLGCLPLPFMWAKWGDAMFPFFRALKTQAFLNVSIWSKAFYMISAYLIGAKLLENHRPNRSHSKRTTRNPNFALYLIRRYIRLVLPMVAFMMLNYVWPRLSNGWVMQDQANKLLAPCDAYGWTNMLLFHNHYQMNETCLWPSHVSASFFQLHIFSYPILLLLLYSLRTQVDSLGVRKMLHIALKYFGLLILLGSAIVGLVYPAYQASQQELIVPFLVDYIDYDNYQRVIEWTVMPTHNHLTSYMVGLMLAYLVVKKRLEQEETTRDSSSDQYLHMDSSFESVVASSTHQLHLGPTFKTTIEANRAALRSELGSSYSSKDADNGQETRACSGYASLVASVFVKLIMLVTLSASWAWTGLGQPMSSNQTFWYMIITKLTFTLSMAYLFYKHFATRRNSTSPWMITRFLVPIGRMSLTAFYVSWLVVWFDLLTSLYQWFPSHYFIIEKYNEIIFMTLVIGMFVYGAFEGIVKIHDYTKSQVPNQTTSTKDPSISKVTGFDAYFTPIQDNDTKQDEELVRETYNEQQNTALNHHHRTLISVELSPVDKPIGTSNKLSTIATLNKATDQSNTSSKQSPNDQSNTGGTGRRLSIADQYRLNTELRANYSFASIGLYETAGATEDLVLARNSGQLSSTVGSPVIDKR